MVAPEIKFHFYVSPNQNTSRSKIYLLLKVLEISLMNLRVVTEIKFDVLFRVLFVKYSLFIV